MRIEHHGKSKGWRIAVGGCAVMGLTLLGSAWVNAATEQATLKPVPALVVPGGVPTADGWTREDAAHLLRRAGFGGTPGQIDALFAMGRDGAVDYLLTGEAPAGAAVVFAPVKLEDFNPAPLPVPDAATQQQIDAAKQARRAAKGGSPLPAGTVEKSQDALKKFQKQIIHVGTADLQRLRGWWVGRMVRTDRPLEEKMTLFWHGLFTSGEKEVKNAAFMEKEILLFHHEALGNYKQLTDDVVHSAAMLKYLNNDQNLAGRPNENLARELMELFTMGEGQGYTETDIKNVARALTGLTPAGKGKARYGADASVALLPRGHDTGMKTIFGKTGNFGPDDVVNLIFSRPEPAKHLAKKLWEFYAYPDPSEADLAPVITALEQSKFDVKPALRAIFTSPAFYSEKAKFALIKSPAELMVEEIRTLGVNPSEDQDMAVQRRLKEMDQELLQPPNVRGWVGGDNWITAATLYTRYNTCSAVVNGALTHNGKAGRDGGRKKQRPMETGQDSTEGATAITPATLFASLGRTPTSEQVVNAAIDRFLERPLSAPKHAALLDVIGTDPLKLGDPASDTRIRQMICLLMSTPEYQVH